jgi:hypothetical protein
MWDRFTECRLAIATIIELRATLAGTSGDYEVTPRVRASQFRVNLRGEIMGKSRFRKNPISIAAAFLLVAAPPAMASNSQTQGPNLATTEPVGPNAVKDQASEGDFGVLQFATIDPETLYKNWEAPTEGVAINATQQMHRGEAILTFITFRGCKADGNGNCKVTADYVAFAPDGTIYGSTKGATIWDMRPPKGVELSMAVYGIRIEQNEPLGDYKISISTTDHVAGITLHTEQTLTAIAN